MRRYALTSRLYAAGFSAAGAPTSNVSATTFARAPLLSASPATSTSLVAGSTCLRVNSYRHCSTSNTSDSDNMAAPGDEGNKKKETMSEEEKKQQEEQAQKKQQKFKDVALSACGEVFKDPGELSTFLMKWRVSNPEDPASFYPTFEASVLKYLKQEKRALLQQQSLEGGEKIVVGADWSEKDRAALSLKHAVLIQLEKLWVKNRIVRKLDPRGFGNLPSEAVQHHITAVLSAFLVMTNNFLVWVERANLASSSVETEIRKIEPECLLAAKTKFNDQLRESWEQIPPNYSKTCHGVFADMKLGVIEYMEEEKVHPAATVGATYLDTLQEQHTALKRLKDIVAATPSQTSDNHLAMKTPLSEEQLKFLDRHWELSEAFWALSPEDR